MSLLITIAVLVSFFSGQRMFLFPPLVVIAYEMFIHGEACPWGRQPLKLAPTCLLTSTLGVLAIEILGPGFFSTVLSMAVGIFVLKLIRLHLPPALAVGLIPQILEEPSWIYAACVFGGCSLLTVVYLVFKEASSSH